MADYTSARTNKRPPRGGRSLGAVRKGAEGNATTATARSGTREPLLSKQTPAYDDTWDEDGWGDSNWGENGNKSEKPYHQSQPISGNHTLPYSSSSRPRSGGGRLGSLSNRGRTCVTAMVVVMMVIGVSLTLSGSSKYRARSSETQKTLIKASITHPEESHRSSSSSSNKNNENSKAAASTELRATPHLEEERKSSSGGSHLHDWDYGNDDPSRDAGSHIAGEIDYEENNDDDDDDNPAHSDNLDFDNEENNDDDENGVWGTAQKSTTSSTFTSKTADDNDYNPASHTTDSAADREPQQQQQQGVQQYEIDYDADYDIPSKADKTRVDGGEEDNSELGDSRGWSGEDVGAAAEEIFFEGDGSFSDGYDIAEIRGEQELEDEEDYGGSVESTGRGDDDDDDDGLEEGEESHFLGRKPDERPLTGGQDWEGDNAAAFLNEGEGEERDADGGRGDYNEASLDEDDDEEEEEGEYDYEGNPIERRKDESSSSFSDRTQLHPHDSSASRTRGAGGGDGTVARSRASGAGTQSQKPASGSGSAFSETFSSLEEDSELGSDFNTLDLEDVDPFTAEKLIEQLEIKQREDEDGAGAFSSVRRSGNENNNNGFEFLDSLDADNDYSNGLGFNELATRDSSTTKTGFVGAAAAVAGKGSPSTTGAATGKDGVRVLQPNDARNKGSRTIPRAGTGGNAKHQAAEAAGAGTDPWNEDYADEEQNNESEEQDLDYSAGEDAAIVPRIEGVGDASLRQSNTAGAKKTAVGATAQGTAASSRSGATTSTRTTPSSTAGSRSGVQKQQQGLGKLVASGSGAGAGAQQQQAQQKSAKTTSSTASTAGNKAKSASASITSSPTKQQGSASAGKNTTIASSTKSNTTTGVGGALKKMNATSASSVAGEARNRRAGSAGGVLPGHGGEEPPENRIESVKVGANKPGEKPSVLPIAPKNTAEAMIRSQKLDDDEGSYNNEDGASAREKTLPAAGVGDDAEEMEKVDAVKSSTKSPPASSGNKSSSEKTPNASSPKKAGTSPSPVKSPTSSKSSSSSGKKPIKGMRRSLRSDLPVVRLKKRSQPYGEEDHQVGEGNQRRKRIVPN